MLSFTTIHLRFFKNSLKFLDSFIQNCSLGSLSNFHLKVHLCRPIRKITCTKITCKQNPVENASTLSVYV